MDELDSLLAAGLTAALPTVEATTASGQTFDAVFDVSQDRGRERRTLLWCGAPDLAERDAVTIRGVVHVLSEPRREGVPVHVVVRRG